VVTLSVHTHLLEEVTNSAMEWIDEHHRDQVRPWCGPNIVELSDRKPSQASEQWVETPGGVSEWSKETVLKTVGPDPGLVGSNPTPSARLSPGFENG
jgi:hypothetical protein